MQKTISTVHMNDISASKNSPNKFIVGSVSVVTAKTITVPAKNSFPMSLMNFVRIVFAAVVPSWGKNEVVQIVDSN